MSGNKCEYKVCFETVTPIFTGDAKRVHKNIKPSAIIGSLRFWFELICYAADITNNSHYKNGLLKAELD